MNWCVSGAGNVSDLSELIDVAVVKVAERKRKMSDSCIDKQRLTSAELAEILEMNKPITFFIFSFSSFFLNVPHDY